MYWIQPRCQVSLSLDNAVSHKVLVQLLHIVGGTARRERIAQERQEQCREYPKQHHVEPATASGCTRSAVGVWKQVRTPLLLFFHIQSKVLDTTCKEYRPVRQLPEPEHPRGSADPLLGAAAK